NPSKVVLPEPDAPRIATVAPRSTSKLTPSRIVSGESPLITVLPSPWARMTKSGMTERRAAAQKTWLRSLGCPQAHATDPLAGSCFQSANYDSRPLRIDGEAARQLLPTPSSPFCLSPVRPYNAG